MSDEEQPETTRAKGKQMYDAIIEHWCYCGVKIGTFHLLQRDDSLAEAKRLHRATHTKKKDAAIEPQKEQGDVSDSNS